MASSPAPATPDNTPRRAVAGNRSFTLPAKLSSPASASKPSPEIGSAKGIETTYIHPNATIFKFQATAPSLGSSPSPGRPNASSSSSGTLPWATPTERTVAAGPFEIYQVPGSVSFLHCGSFLQALLPKSQCWCVDGTSKFVVRGSIDTYYRIEVPGETAEDLEEVEKLKATFQKMIYYEKTPCPFARTFTVDLPAQAEQPEPRKKRRRHTEGRAKKWKLDRAYGWRPEGWEPGMDEPEPEDDSDEEAESESDNESSGSEEAEDTSELADRMKSMNVGPSARSRAMQALRSATARSRQTPQRPTPSKLRPQKGMDGTEEARETTLDNSIAGARDDGVDNEVDDHDATSGAEMDQVYEIPIDAEVNQDAPVLRTFQAIPTDMPPSPPDSSAGLDHLDLPVSVPTSGWVQVERTVEEGPLEEPEDRAIPESDVPQEEESLNVEETLTAEIEDEGVEQGESATHSPSHAAIVEKVSASPEPIASPATTPNHPRSVRISDDLELEAPPVTAEVANDILLPPSAASEDGQSPDGVDTPPSPERRTKAEDPYAAIQARILARRSLSGTTSFHPLQRSSMHSSTSSTSSAATIISNKSSPYHRTRQQQEDLATTMAKKVYAVFLGPPAHLVALMLRIAARFASGTFGVNGMFHVESSVDSLRRPPGSYHLQTDGEVVEAVEGDDDREWNEEDEDDFGVKLNQPVSHATGVRQRKSYDVD